jgi:hypothetical protein
VFLQIQRFHDSEHRIFVNAANFTAGFEGVREKHHNRRCPRTDPVPDCATMPRLAGAVGSTPATGRFQT